MKVIESFDNTLWFGKYKGKTINQVINDDPSYILWMADETDIEISEDIILSAQWVFDDHTFGSE